MSRTSLAVRRRVQVAVIGLTVAVSGCGLGEPRSIEPAGVDGLEIPTASPDPRDFVRTIDNPYLPLAAGSEWTYESNDGLGETTTVAVNGEPRTIAGVAATEVTTTVRGRRAPTTSTDYFAQDRMGNVWSFGSEDWTAGTDGAQAGLVMPATPRVGDGFVQQYAEGVAQDRSQVLATAASASTAYGSWSDVVEVLEVTGVIVEVETRRFYAPGVGLVLAETADATTELVSYTTTDPNR